MEKNVQPKKKLGHVINKSPDLKHVSKVHKYQPLLQVVTHIHPCTLGGHWSACKFHADEKNPPGCEAGSLHILILVGLGQDCSPTQAIRLSACTCLAPPRISGILR